VKLATGSYKLAYRRGYFAEDAKVERAAASKPATDPLIPLIPPGMPDSTEIPVAVRIQTGTQLADSHPVQLGANDKGEGQLPALLGGVCGGRKRIAV
jgi:hypothetical protein